MIIDLIYLEIGFFNRIAQLPQLQQLSPSVAEKPLRLSSLIDSKPLFRDWAWLLMSAVTNDPMETADAPVDDKNGNGEDGVTKSPPKLSYSRELMMKLKNHPKSKEKPSTFDVADMVSKSGMWDPEHWMTRTYSRDPKRPTPGTIGTLIKDEQLEKVSFNNILLFYAIYPIIGS